MKIKFLKDFGCIAKGEMLDVKDSSFLQGLILEEIVEKIES